MNLEMQIMHAISKLESEKMWNTLEENEIIKLSLPTEEIYCSFLGKNVGYYGIEFFLGKAGKKALLERMETIYYPEYIYTYRQNSIVILINSKIVEDQISQPLIKVYRYHRLPRNLLLTEQLRLLEYLSVLYDAVKLMQSQNIYGKFEKTEWLHYFYDKDTFQYQLKWELQTQIVEKKAFHFSLQTIASENDNEVEFDVFPIASGVETAETDYQMQYGLFLVERKSKQLIYREMILEQKQLYQRMQETLIHLMQYHGLFKKIYVRDWDMYYFLKQLFQTEVVIDSELSGIDAIVTSYIEED